MMEREEASKLAVAQDVDVLVVGGGPAGVAAALAAARNGADTLIIEQFNCLGGVATAGGHGHISRYDENGTGRRIVGGIAHEIGTKVAAGGFGVYTSYGIWFEVEGLKALLEQMADEAGVGLLYHTFFCDTIVEDGAAAGAVIQNKGGRQVIRAKRLIDCTGDGDAAFRAGCPCETGRPADGRCQPVTLMFTIGGVDWERVKAWRKDFQMKDVWEEAQKKGDMRPFQKTIMGWWWTPTRPDEVNVNFTHMIHVDSTKAEDLTRATIEGRKQVAESIEVFRKYVPGMEKCYLVATFNTVGIRESRRVMGDYVLTEDDIREQRAFPDAVCYGSFFVDVHNIDGPGMDPTTWHPPTGFKYQVPWRVCLPRGVENLLVAGRCVSCTHLALGSLRVMVPCMALGEACGTAAALSLKDGISPRQLPAETLRAQLRRQGCILDKADIVPAAAAHREPPGK